MATLVRQKVGEAKKMSGTANIYAQFKTPEKIDIMTLNENQERAVKERYMNELKECIDYNCNQSKWLDGQKKSSLEIWLQRYPQYKKDVDKYFPEAML